MTAFETKIIEHPFLKTLPAELLKHLLTNACEAEFKAEEI